jgi:probable rRNA maturation factor
LDKAAASCWIQNVIETEGYRMGKLEYHFVGDKRLLEINQKFLNHDTLTDIISFDFSKDSWIIGEIYISLERVSENAILNKTTPDEELKRIMIHGVLHFIGYKDKTPSEKNTMTQKEDYYLSLSHKYPA